MEPTFDGAGARVDFDIEVFHGDEIDSYLGSVARLRIEQFREFPYLYDGDLAYERSYLAQFSESEHCVFVIVKDEDGQVVGASTAVRMDDADSAFQRPFEGQDLAQICYFGESVLAPDYRGLGIGHTFFEEREKFAGGIGCTTCTFCSVVRPPGHSSQPDDYRPLDSFWHKRGYIRLDHLRTQFPWREVGERHESDHEMVFWVRALGT